jgi:glyoxalase family protein
MLEGDLEGTIAFLTDAMGFTAVGEEHGWQRYALGSGGSGQYLDLRAAPETPRGAWGTGSIHHLAWRVNDEAHQLEARETVLCNGAHPTPVIDRFWFKSVYFREPGGVLFELATDGPGFHVDEKVELLGESLVLPPWLEPNREAIEKVLPNLTMPHEIAA